MTFDSTGSYDTGLTFDDITLLPPYTPPVMATAITAGVVDVQGAPVLQLTNGTSTLDLQDPDNGLWVTTFDPGAPTVREVLDDLPGQDGQYDETTYLSTRVVVLSGVALGSPSKSIRQAVDALGPYLAPAARPQLVFSLDGSTPKRVLTLRASQWSQPVAAGNIAFSYQWKCSDPLAYSQTPSSTLLLPGSSTVGVTPPLTPPLTLPSSYGGPGLYVNTLGNYQTWPTLAIYGPVTQPVVTWLDPVAMTPTGTQVAFTSALTVKAGDYLEINTRNRTVYLNGDPGASRYSFLDFANNNWGPLQPGPNLLRFSGSATAPPAQCEVIWSDAWL